jgi:hypothetical protein
MERLGIFFLTTPRGVTRGVVQVKGKGEIETWLLHGQLRAAEVVR